MMRTKLLGLAGLLVTVAVVACSGRDDFNKDFELTSISFDQTFQFDNQLSAYNIYAGDPSQLEPNKAYELLELSSTLFTDYAHKQRLVKVPYGTKIDRKDLINLDFPNGTILVKTFFYYHDERDRNLGKRLIETRLLIKEAGKWNAATYVWHSDQSDATLKPLGADTEISWVNVNGRTMSTLYQIPSQADCGTCHQSNREMTPLGPNLMNLNKIVDRSGRSLNQLSHLQAIGILNDFPIEEIPSIVNYEDINIPINERGRAYLAMNCAHCHNPSGWEKASQRRFDFRYNTSLSQTGIADKKNKISRTMLNGRMPFNGTTMIHQEGIGLIQEYLRGL